MAISYGANTPSHRIHLVPHIDSPRAFRFEPISCDLRDGDAPLRICRYIEHSGIYVATDVTFKSKVVSRAHAEIWFNNGKFYIKDTKSSSGTFLNHDRLSLADSESERHLLKNGDIVQLGVDFKGGKENIHKCVKIRIEVERQYWQATPYTLYSSYHPSSSSNPTSQPTAEVSEPHRSTPGDREEGHAMSASDGVGSYNPILEAGDGSKQKSLMSRIFSIRRRGNITSAIPSYRAPLTPDVEWDSISVMKQGTRIAQDSDSQETNIYVDSLASARHTSQQLEEEDERDENKLRLKEEEVQRWTGRITRKISTPHFSETAVTEKRTSPEIPHSTSNSPQDLTNQLQGRSNYPVTSGGFGDIWKCELVKSDETIQVAVKTIRAFESDDDVMMRKNSERVRRELKVLGYLKHECILPLWGVASNFGPYPAMVYPWVDSGALTGFLERQQDVLSSQNKFSILNDIALGLQYLHNKSIVHGDLTGSNVLICSNGRACLADFGLSAMIMEFVGSSYLTSSIRGNIRWAAAELFEVPEDDDEEEAVVSLSIECDIYSFGSIALQVLTCKVPYYYVKKDNVVLGQVMKGKKPEPPKESQIAPLHLEFIRRCWLSRAYRPTVGEIVAFVACEREALVSCLPSTTMTGFAPEEDTNSDFTSQISGKLRSPVTTGSFGEVYRCTVESSKGKKEVAVKVLKIDPTRTTEKLQKAMLRELEIWLRLKHSTIVPLLGTARVEPPLLALVSQWMSSGTLFEYLNEQAMIITPSARIRLAKGIAEGLIYLHSENVIHGDLHPANVLIDGSGNPCLADFGLATVAENPDLQWTTTTVGRILDSRWRAPEVLGIDGDPERPTFKSDIYSFGSVMFFIISGDIPWKEKKHSIQICIELSKRTTPARPHNIFGSHWDLIQQCWTWNPEHRPVATIVRERAADLRRQQEGVYGKSSHYSPLSSSESLTIVSPDGASAYSVGDSVPFSAAYAAIMADAFSKALRKPDFAGPLVEEANDHRA